MKFIHTSDWHLGRRLHSEDLSDAHQQFLTWLLDQALATGVDAVVVAGDVYDRAQPPADAVKLLNDTVADFAAAGIPLIITSGNHDNAVRLNYGKSVFASSGIHLRTEFDSITDPVILADDHGPVGFYGVPYLVPDDVMDRLGAERSHESVLSAVSKMIIDDAAERQLTRTVVMAHAFVTGGTVSESEREIRVGGIGDTPASVFDGFSYVALGHLHGPQAIELTDSATTLGYSGSPIAFSFSERDHTKSVSMVEIDAAGSVAVERVEVPTTRRLIQLEGKIDELIQRAPGDLAHLADAWVKVILTDSDRPVDPMPRLRAVWPHTLVLDFAPEAVQIDLDADLKGLQGVTDPVEITQKFYAYVTGESADEAHERVIHDAVEAVAREELSA